MEYYLNMIPEQLLIIIIGKLSVPSFISFTQEFIFPDELWRRYLRNEYSQIVNLQLQLYSNQFYISYYKLVLYLKNNWVPVSSKRYSKEKYEAYFKVKYEIDDIFIDEIPIILGGGNLPNIIISEIMCRYRYTIFLGQESIFAAVKRLGNLCSWVMTGSTDGFNNIKSYENKSPIVVFHQDERIILPLDTDTRHYGARASRGRKPDTLQKDILIIYIWLLSKYPGKMELMPHETTTPPNYHIFNTRTMEDLYVFSDLGVRNVFSNLSHLSRTELVRLLMN